MARLMILRELMSSPVLTAEPEETLASVAARMHDGHVGSVVVVDEGTCRGILTERDLMGATGSGAGPEANVGEWMTVDPISAGPETTWNEASEILREYGFRHLPVVEDGLLIGVVSVRDLLKVAFLQAMEG